MVLLSVLGIGLRLVIAAANAAQEMDTELSTPATSALCRREAAFLLSRGLSPMEHGGSCGGTPPLLLAILGTEPKRTLWLLVLSDLMCAGLLCDLGVRWRAAPSDSLGPSTAQVLAASLVLLSPWTAAACAVGSAATVPGLCILLAVRSASRGPGAPITTAAALALATHASPDLIWMVGPVVSLLVRTRESTDASATTTTTTTTTGTASAAVGCTATYLLLFGLLTAALMLHAPA